MFRLRGRPRRPQSLSRRGKADRIPRHRQTTTPVAKDEQHEAEEEHRAGHSSDDLESHGERCSGPFRLLSTLVLVDCLFRV